MLGRSKWQITTFCHKIYIFGFHLKEAILKVKSTCRFYFENGFFQVKAEYIDFMTKSSYLPFTSS